ncbi:MAG: hypothetical protein BalsKO_06890 [Balneolaceae bacterium]
MNIKRVFFATMIIWTLGVSAYVGSYFVTILNNPALQANLVLLIALIPSAMVGANFYYRKATAYNGWLLGMVMFGFTILLDAAITVPVFIIPEGGNHITFFSDPGFWLIGVVYVSVIGIYSKLHKKYVTRKMSMV